MCINAYTVQCLAACAYHMLSGGLAVWLGEIFCCCWCSTWWWKHWEVWLCLFDALTHRIVLNEEIHNFFFKGTTASLRQVMPNWPCGRRGIMATHWSIHCTGHLDSERTMFQMSMNHITLWLCERCIVSLIILWTWLSGENHALSHFFFFLWCGIILHWQYHI